MSCDEPVTILTNYVHPDGSVTRKVEMRNKKNEFKKSDIQVPLDSTWIVKDSLEIGLKGDTTWIKRAEKYFKNVEEINQSYKSDSGGNKGFSRQAGFQKSFKWFNTEYRFSEKLDTRLLYGYPLKDFLNKDELQYFYYPEDMRGEKERSADSLKYKALRDSVNKKTDHWLMKSLVSEWIGLFSNLAKSRTDNTITKEVLKAREDEMVNLIETNDAKFDSLWSNRIILKKLLGESDAVKYWVEADSAMKILSDKKIYLDFKDYSLSIVMPGKLIGTNGFFDSSHTLIWPVKSDYFLTEPYEMWAESKASNTWAWIVSGIFLGFVVAGVIVRVIKKD
jgi:hypothetical protein